MVLIEPIVLIIAIIAVCLLLHSAKHVIINAIMGIIILSLANFIFHIGIKYSAWVILMCVIGGMPGAILVIILHILGIAF